jgi:hypothetical protein
VQSDQDRTYSVEGRKKRSRNGGGGGGGRGGDGGGGRGGRRRLDSGVSLVSVQICFVSYDSYS